MPAIIAAIIAGIFAVIVAILNKEPAEPANNDPEPAQYANACRYDTGPRAGKIHHFSSMQLKMKPAFIGEECHNDDGSVGVMIQY